MIPNSRTALKEYCLRKLGKGLNDINITDEQIDDRIDDVIQKYNDFAENGTLRTYFKHKVTADDIANQYVELPASITGVIRVLQYGAGGAAQGSPFNIEYQLRMNDMFDLGATSMLYYTQTMQHLDMLDMLLNGQPQFRFNRVMDRLHIDAKWGPGGKIREDMWIIVEAYSAVDPNEFIKFWNEIWVKEYTTALLKQQWGANLKLFSGVALIGGVTINGQQLWEEASADIERLEEELTEKWQSPPQFFMG